MVPSLVTPAYRTDSGIPWEPIRRLQRIAFAPCYAPSGDAWRHWHEFASRAAPG